MSRDVPPRPSRHRTWPRMAPLLEIPDPHRLSAGPLRGDPPRSDRQASRLPYRTGLAPGGPYTAAPPCDLGGRFRAVAARAATALVGGLDPLGAGPEWE